MIESLTAATSLEYMIADYDALWHVLPNVSVTGAGMTGDSISDVTGGGRVTEVQPAYGFVARGGDGESVELVDFDDPVAQWRTIFATVDIDESLGGVQVGDSLVWQVSYYEDPQLLESFAQGLRDLGQVVLPLTERSRTDGGLLTYRVVEGDRLLVLVSGDGSLSLPVMESETRATRLLEATPTLSRLREKSQGEESVRIG